MRALAGLSREPMARSELPAAERSHFDALLMNFLRGVEVSFYQEANGLLDADFYHGWIEEALEIWRQPGARDWWSENAQYFDHGFRAVWERRLAGEGR